MAVEHRTRQITAEWLHHRGGLHDADIVGVRADGDAVVLEINDEWSAFSDESSDSGIAGAIRLGATTLTDGLAALEGGWISDIEFRADGRLHIVMCDREAVVVDAPCVEWIPGEIRRHAEMLWAFHARSDEVGEPAAIVCLGSYDLRVAHRAADLALAHPAARVVATGAHGNWTRGLFEATEAEVFGKVLAERGVPQDRLMLETRATNIGENIAFSRDILGFADGDTVVFVTKPQTQTRVRATVPVHWPLIQARITAPLLTLDDYGQTDRGLAPVIEEMVGDLERMAAYPARGFQVPVEIPAQVLAAAEALKAAGFDGHGLRAG